MGIVAENVKSLIWKIATEERYSKIAGGFIMHTAVDTRDVELVDLLIKNNGYLDTPNEDGYTPLHLSVFNGDYAMSKLLLEAGAQPNICCINTYESPLHFAAIHGDKELLMLLIEHGADVNLYDKNRITPLEQLLYSGHRKLFVQLFGEFEHFAEQVDNKTLFGCYEVTIRMGYEEVKTLIKELLTITSFVKLQDEH